MAFRSINGDLAVTTQGENAPPPIDDDEMTDAVPSVVSPVEATFFVDVNPPSKSSRQFSSRPPSSRQQQQLAITASLAEAAHRAAIHETATASGSIKGKGGESLNAARLDEEPSTTHDKDTSSIQPGKLRNGSMSSSQRRHASSSLSDQSSKSPSPDPYLSTSMSRNPSRTTTTGERSDSGRHPVRMNGNNIEGDEEEREEEVMESSESDEDFSTAAAKRRRGRPKGTKPKPAFGRTSAVAVVPIVATTSTPTSRGKGRGKVMTNSHTGSPAATVDGSGSPAPTVPLPRATRATVALPPGYIEGVVSTRMPRVRDEPVAVREASIVSESVRGDSPMEDELKLSPVKRGGKGKEVERERDHHRAGTLSAKGTPEPDRSPCAFIRVVLYYRPLHQDPWTDLGIFFYY